MTAHRKYNRIDPVVFTEHVTREKKCDYFVKTGIVCLLHANYMLGLMFLSVRDASVGLNATLEIFACSRIVVLILECILRQ